MSIREDRTYLSALKQERQALSENAEQKRNEDFNNAVIAREDAIAAHESKIDKFYAYKDNVKRTLLKEALMHIYEGSITNISNREHIICEHLLDQYITETGVSQLLKNMKFSRSGLLMTIQEEANEFADEITKDANAEDDSTQIIDPEDVEKFWKEIENSENIEDITNLIRLRVSNAEEEFVNKNQEDKEDVKTILKNTATRVNLAKTSNDNDYSEAVEESETRLAKQKIYQIQHESRHNVFDRMVRNLSESVIQNEDAKKEYTLENGRLDMDKIVESVRCMYTLLEMVGTIQLENVDQQYIEDTLKSIK